METTPSCPQCGAKGRKVEALTLLSLISAEARNRLGKGDGFRFCATATCEVVYFEPRTGDRFRKADLAVPVFQKSTNPSRLVCYCFEHSVKAVREDAVHTGESTIAEAITQMCRQGLDRCEELNPQGSCCLGNVRKVARAALAKTRTPETQEASSAETPACCAPRTER